MSLLHRLLLPWLRMKIVPRDFREHQQTDHSVCYILAKKSFSDLLVLEQVCRQKNLLRPRIKPTYLPQVQGGGSYVFLDFHDRKKRGVAILERMIRALKTDPAKEIRIVPVSIFWGRNPGRKESSFLRAFFSDAESLNPIRKLFIILVQGRDILVNFGKPISLQDFVREDKGSDHLCHKLTRVLRVHFRTQKNAALGPHLYNRKQVVKFLLRSQNVMQVIESEARKKGVPIEKIQKTARKNLEIISADLSPRFVLIFYIFLNWFFKKIFTRVEVHHSPTLAQTAQTDELIYLPSHRSHIDYLLLSFVLYREGLMIPHFGSGDNLNFWLVGTLLRKGGAFFLRRKFRGQRLYTTLFSEYMHYLVSKGYPLCFFLEGMRSRTGFLLEPKTGMLAMIANSYLRDDYRKVSLVPVYIGYDNVVEAQTFVTEIRGNAKSAESFFSLLRATKILRSSFGKAHVAFGEPISLSKVLTARKHDTFSVVINDIAHTVMQGITDHIVVTPTSLVATILLAKPQKSITVNEFIGLYKVLRLLAQKLDWANNVKFPDLEPSTMMHEVENMSQIKRFCHEGGDILYLDNHHDPTLVYAGNNVVAVFMIPALIAQFFRTFDRIKHRDLVNATIDYYHLMKREFFQKWEHHEIERVVIETIEVMLSKGLLVKHHDLSPPSIADDNFLLLHNFSFFMEKIFSQYAILVTMLTSIHDHATISRSELTTQFTLLLKRVTILKGDANPEYGHNRVASYQIENFKKMALLTENAEGMLRISPKLHTMARSSANFLGRDIKQSIVKIAQTL